MPEGTRSRSNAAMPVVTAGVLPLLHGAENTWSARSRWPIGTVRFRRPCALQGRGISPGAQLRQSRSVLGHSRYSRSLTYEAPRLFHPVSAIRLALSKMLTKAGPWIASLRVSGNYRVLMIFTEEE